MASETDARPGRAHPEAELIAAAGDSDGTRVKLRITNVYNSSSSEVVNLEATNTVGDLKKLIEDAFPSRPSPDQQRLIYRGKQCQEAQQLGHVLRGVDLSVQHSMHLVVTQPVEQKPAAERADPVSQQSSPRRPRPPSSDSGSTAANVSGPPNERERMELSSTQMAHLQWQYQQALRENQQALLQHQQRYQFLSSQSNAFTQQQGPALGQPGQQQQQQRQRQQQFDPYQSEVATTTATRALGGNMPGPAGGGAVRDLTGVPSAGFIPAAGLGEDGEAGRGNLTDPPPRAPDVRRHVRGWFKTVVQCIGVILVFGIDADGWMLVCLAIGGLVAVLFKTGLLKEMLGSEQEGGGLWTSLSTSATVVTEGGGLIMDARFFLTAFMCSLFPKWKPVRSPEAIAAEAAAQAAAQAAQEARAEAAQEAIAGREAEQDGGVQADAQAVDAVVREGQVPDDLEEEVLPVARG